MISVSSLCLSFTCQICGSDPEEAAVSWMNGEHASSWSTCSASLFLPLLLDQDWTWCLLYGNTTIHTYTWQLPACPQTLVPSCIYEVCLQGFPFSVCLLSTSGPINCCVFHVYLLLFCFSFGWPVTWASLRGQSGFYRFSHAATLTSLTGLHLHHRQSEEL